MLRTKAKDKNEVHILFRAQKAVTVFELKEQWLNAGNLLCQAYIYSSGTFEKTREVCPAVRPSAWSNSAPTRRT